MDEYLAFGNGEEIKGKARQDFDTLFVYLEDATMNLYQAFALLSVREKSSGSVRIFVLRALSLRTCKHLCFYDELRGHIERAEIPSYR